MKMKVWLKEPNGEVLSPDDAAACWISAQHNALALRTGRDGLASVLPPSRSEFNVGGRPSRR
jgi:hypothetical protein